MSEGKSFKDLLNEKYAEDVVITARPVVTDLEQIMVKSQDATLEEAEEIWPLLEASLDISKGYGLAAIQIGIPKKVALINYNGKIYRLLNTRIVDRGPIIIIYNEGCLSIPSKTVHTERYQTLKVFDDVLGELDLSVSKDGLLPIIVQHEIDHFNGEIIFNRVRKPVQSMDAKIGRNSICFCGSGKKYKKCCRNKDL